MDDHHLKNITKLEKGGEHCLNDVYKMKISFFKFEFWP
jgi:hypothetical protein